MSRSLRIALAAVFSLAVCGTAAAQQEPLTLTLQEVIDRAQTKSPAAEIARLGYEGAQWDYKAYRAQYLPSFALEGNGPGLERAINAIDQDDGSVRYVPQSQMRSNVGLSVYQPIPHTGGRFFVSSGLRRVDLFGDFKSNQWQAAPVEIGFVQPLFQFNTMKWQRRLEPMRYRLARREFTEDVAASAVQAASLFFDVYIAKMNADRAAFNVAVNDTIYQLSRGRFELGKIAENDLLQSELQLLNAQTDLSNARIAYDRAMQDLKITLGLPYDREVEIVPPLEVPRVSVEPAEAVEQARRNRADFLEMDLTSLEAERNVEQARFENGFSANLTASYGLNQSGTDLGYIYANPLNQQRFSIGFSMPLYSWGRGRAEFESALTQQEETQRTLALQREELEQEVYFEALQFRQLQQQVALAAKADTIAARRFEVARNRYTIGKIDITDLFDAQQAKDLASQGYIRTLRDFWVSFFRLRRMTLYDFVRNQGLGEPSN